MLTVHRLRWRNQLRRPSYHYPRIQWTSSCTPNCHLPLHYGLGSSTLGLPSLPNSKNRQRWPLRWQTRQVLSVLGILGISDAMGMDRFSASDSTELSKRYSIPSACVWHWQGYRRGHSICHWVYNGECERCAKVSVQVQGQWQVCYLRQRILFVDETSELLRRDHYSVL